MSPLPFLTAVALASSLAAAATPEVKVHAQLVEVTGGAKLAKDPAKIAPAKGVSVLTAPDFKTRSGRATTISLVRDFATNKVIVSKESPSPAKTGVPPVGVVLTVCPTLRNGDLGYSLNYEYTDFNGFVGIPPAMAATYTTRKGIGLSGSSREGETVVVDLTSKDEKQQRKIYAVLSFTKA